MMLLADLLDDDLAAGLGPELRALPIATVTHNSRACGADSLFAAWQGSVADGHRYVPEARAAGAVFVLCQRALTADVPHLVCADPRRALARAAWRLHAADVAPLKLVGITGTNGKTTCAHLVAGLLAATGAPGAAIGTLGVSQVQADGTIERQPLPGSLTTPESADLYAALAALGRAKYRGVAVEATSIALVQGRLEALSFDVCAMTNLSHDHLDFHHTMEAYGAAKALLFSQHAKPGAPRVLNADDAFQRTLRQGDDSTVWYSCSGSKGRTGQMADVFPISQQQTREGIALQAMAAGQRISFRSALVGHFNLDNLLLCIAVGVALGLPAATIERGLATLAGVPGRLERVRGPTGFESSSNAPLVLVDYAHTPDALARALAACRALSPAGRLICVFGCGGDRDTKKRAPMGAIAAQAADLAIVTNDNPRSEKPELIAAAIEEGLLEGGARPAGGSRIGAGSKHAAQYRIELDRGRAIAAAIAAAGPRDTVLIAGKGHETVQIIGGAASAFDDRHVAAACLAAPERLHAAGRPR